MESLLLNHIKAIPRLIRKPAIPRAMIPVSSLAPVAASAPSDAGAVTGVHCAYKVMFPVLGGL